MTSIECIGVIGEGVKMKKFTLKKHILNVVMMVSFLILLSQTACSTTKDNSISSQTAYSTKRDNSISSQMDSNKYIIQDVFYQVYEEGLQEYRYRIGTSRKTFSEGVTERTEPKIENIGDGVIRLHIGSGTNAFTVQYFDVYKDRTSEEFYPYTIYADYYDEKTGEGLIAYFRLLPNSSGKYILNVKDIFNKNGCSAEIDKDFISPICNRIVFLNESELYIDYDVYAEGYSYGDVDAEYVNKREIVKFR